MCGARGAPRPCTTASGMRATSAASSVSRMAESRVHVRLALFRRQFHGARESHGRRDVLRAGRRPRSCDPPKKSGSSGVPRRMKNAPIPLGAPTLCPLTEAKSNGILRASTSTLPNACTASVWNRPPAALVSSASSAIGWITPVSLLIHITEQSARSPAVSFALASPRSTVPAGSTASSRSSAPSLAAWCTACNTALCSIGVDTTTVFPCALRIRQPPSTARLSPSVPPDVKQTSSGAAPRQLATRSRASSRAARASRPQRCVLDGLPKRGPKKGVMASRTSGRTGVVAAWSR
jgi:hypothetical protein